MLVYLSRFVAEDLMADNIFIKTGRIASAQIHVALGRAEQASGTALMRHAIAEADTLAAATRSQIERTQDRIGAIDHAIATWQKELTDWQGKARFALDMDREDLAQGALSRQLDIEKQIEAAKAERAEHRLELSRQQAAQADIASQRREMADELARVERAQATGSPSNGGGKPGADTVVARRMERIQEIFDRSRDGVDRKTGTSADDRANAAEIDAMLREEEIARRLAAMRQPATKKPRRPKQS